MPRAAATRKKYVTGVACGGRTGQGVAVAVVFPGFVQRGPGSINEGDKKQGTDYQTGLLLGEEVL